MCVLVRKIRGNGDTDKAEMSQAKNSITDMISEKKMCLSPDLNRGYHGHNVGS